MDDCFAYGQNPSQLRERYYEAHDLVMKAWQRAGHLRVQRPLQPAALRQHLAAPGAAAASAGLDSRRRLDRDLAVVRRDGLRLLLSVLLRPQDRQGDDGRLLGGNGPPRQGSQSVSRRLRADRRRGRKPRPGDGTLHRGRRVFLRPLPAHRSALCRAARLHDRSDDRASACTSQVSAAAARSRRGRPR